MSNQFPNRTTVVIAALLGALSASQVFARRAKADCASWYWKVELLSVTANDGNTTHHGYWPTEGMLESFNGRAEIHATDWTPGVVVGIGATR